MEPTSENGNRPDTAKQCPTPWLIWTESTDEYIREMIAYTEELQQRHQRQRRRNGKHASHYR